MEITLVKAPHKSGFQTVLDLLRTPVSTILRSLSQSDRFGRMAAGAVAVSAFIYVVPIVVIGHLPYSQFSSVALYEMRYPTKAGVDHWHVRSDNDFVHFIYDPVFALAKRDPSGDPNFVSRVLLGRPTTPP